MLCKNKERYVWEIMDPCLKKMLKENVETKKKQKKLSQTNLLCKNIMGQTKRWKSNPNLKVILDYIEFYIFKKKRPACVEKNAINVI